jgi:protoporphyrinogen/coproporphyrinogen III oxidase
MTAETITPDKPKNFDVIIVGAGISGLTTAWYLKQLNPNLRVCVLEGSSSAGGKIATTEIAGVRVDCGPDAFLARVPGGVELATELGLKDELIAPATGKAYVWSRGKLCALPEGLVLGVPTNLKSLARSRILSPVGLARAAFDEYGPLVQMQRNRSIATDPSVRVAIGQHLGREVVDRLVDPLLGGINASDCTTLSLASAAPNLVEPAKARRLMRALRETNAAQHRGSVGAESNTEDRPVFLAPQTGVRTLIDRMHTDLFEQVRLSTEVTSITRSKHSGAFNVTTRTETLTTSHVVIAVPAAAAAQLLRYISPAATNELLTIRTSSVALTLLTYKSGDIGLPPGSGMLVPRVEKRFLTASSWWNHKWPHLATPGHVLLRASTGRDGDERFLDQSDDEVIDRLHHDLQAMLPIRSQPTEAIVTRWPNGFPQYDCGHGDRVAAIEHALTQDAPNVSITGASFHGIGIPACIRSAKRTAEAVAETVARAVAGYSR